jgi:polyhydroxyalkanoate synthesis regulator phasin
MGVREMSDILKKAIALGLGLTAVSREKVEQFVEDLVAKGEVAQSESKEAVNRLIARGEEQRLEIKRMVQDQVKKILSDLDVATKQDLKDLEHKLTSSTPPSK